MRYRPAAGYRMLMFMGMLIFIGISNRAIAQQRQSIHIQTEAGQFFTATLDGQGYSSSRVGYMLIPNIAPGEHTILISVPEDPHEYSFSCRVEASPLGFSLKQGIDNSWILFDMVDYTFTKGIIAQKAPVQVEAPIVQPVAGTPAKDRPASQIRKIFDKSSASGIDQVYVVVNGARTDTVAIFIPVLEAPAAAQQAANQQASINSQGNDQAIIARRQQMLVKNPRTTDYRLQTRSTFVHAPLLPRTSL